MGACFDAAFINATDKSEAGKQFEDALEQDRIENGHSYSGTIGMANGYKFTDQSFTCPNAAETWVEENASKWGPALAVRLTTGKYDGWYFGAICSS